ncbi:MAG: ribosomal protein L7/L12 [Myxococcales bacterium]|nr:ribosomal protein L7/L12 [Myxococcales bacterium]
MDPQEKLDVVITAFAADRAVAPEVELRRVFGIDLARARQLVDSLPVAVQTGVTSVRAEYFRRALEAIGARVEVRDAGGKSIEAPPKPAAAHAAAAPASLDPGAIALATTERPPGAGAQAVAGAPAARWGTVLEAAAQHSVPTTAATTQPEQPPPARTAFGPSTLPEVELPAAVRRAADTAAESPAASPRGGGALRTADAAATALRAPRARPQAPAGAMPVNAQRTVAPVAGGSTPAPDATHARRPGARRREALADVAAFDAEPPVAASLRMQPTGATTQAEVEVAAPAPMGRVPETPAAAPWSGGAGLELDMAAAPAARVPRNGLGVAAAGAPLLPATAVGAAELAMRRLGSEIHDPVAPGPRPASTMPEAPAHDGALAAPAGDPSPLEVDDALTSGLPTGVGIEPPRLHAPGIFAQSDRGAAGRPSLGDTLDGQARDGRSFWEVIIEAIVLPFSGSGLLWIVAIAVWSVLVGILGVLASFVPLLGAVVTFFANSSLLAISADYFRVCFWVPLTGEQSLEQRPSFDPARVLNLYVKSGLHLTLFVILSQVMLVLLIASKVMNGAGPIELLTDPLLWLAALLPGYYWAMAITTCALSSDFTGVWNFVVGIRAIARAPLEYSFIAGSGVVLMVGSAVAMALVGSITGIAGALLTATAGLPLALSHGVMGALMGYLARTRPEVFED